MKTNRLHLTLFFALIFVAVSCEKENDPTWSHNYKKIDGSENGLYDFYLYDVNSNVTTKITSSSDTLESSYSISPDSKKVIYVNVNGINEMNLDGSKNRIIVTKGIDPCYSPNGDKLIYIDDNKLYVINIDGSNKKLLCNTDLVLWHPIWSKDGEYIVCSSDNGLCVISLDGELQIITSGYSADWYDWSNDSKEIYYSKFQSNGLAQIFKYNMIQKKEYQITNNDKYNYSPKYNPGKNAILFTSGQQNYGTDLITSDEDGLNQNVIINKDIIGLPYWSPNGDKIVFITEESNLAIVNIDGSNYKIINELPGACIEPPIWTNDGNYILYYRAIYYY